MTRLGILAVSAATLLVVGVKPAAGGGNPIEMGQFEESFAEEPDLFVLEVCGVEMRAEFDTRGTFTAAQHHICVRLESGFATVLNPPGRHDARQVTLLGTRLPDQLLKAVMVSRRSAEGRRDALAIERPILVFTLRRDLGFPRLAQRSVADTP